MINNQAIERLRQEIAHIDEQIEHYYTIKHAYENAIETIILDKKLYETDSSQYAGKYLEKVTLIIDNGSYIEFKYFRNVNVDENGHFRAYEWGEMSHFGFCWNDEKQSYVTDCCFDNDGEPVKIIGFYDVKVEE